MPTKWKRVNMTIPPEDYAMLQHYKEREGIKADTTYCWSIIKRYLVQQRDKDMETMKNW